VWERTDRESNLLVSHLGGLKQYSSGRREGDLLPITPRGSGRLSPSLPEILNIFMIFSQYDNYPVMWPFAFGRTAVTHAVFSLRHRCPRGRLDYDRRMRNTSRTI